MTDEKPIQHHPLESMSDGEGIAVEDKLWWLLGRKPIIRRYLEGAITPGAGMTIMDIGCGSGGSLDVLAEFGEVIGVEPSAVLARRARQRGIAKAVFQQDALNLDECRDVDLFTMFDVLEHIEDDHAFLRKLRERAPQNHQLLISVPALQFLFSDHDRILHHCRRYSGRRLRSTLTAAGYRVRRMSYFMFLLFPLALAARMKDKLMARLGRPSKSLDVSDVPRFLSVPFAASLKLEAFLSKGIRLPVGLWLFALAESRAPAQHAGTLIDKSGSRERPPIDPGRQEKAGT